MKSDIRPANTYRDRVIETLQEAFCEDRLQEQEFSERISRALGAKSESDLESLVFDLPILPEKPSSVGRSTTPVQARQITAILGGSEQKGSFGVPEHLYVTAILGGCSLDFRQAKFSTLVTTLHATAILGGIDIVVPPHVQVEIEGTPILGGFSNRTKSSHKNPPIQIIRIIGKAILGGVDVKVKNDTIFH